MEDVNDPRITETVEGRTRILVPARSLLDDVPPKEPAFFNPRARRGRDFAVAAYAAFAKEFRGPSRLLDCMSGVGALGLRVGHETESFKEIIANDVNPEATRLAARSAALNKIAGFKVSGAEACAFLSRHSARGERGAAVDVDPFGSPARYMDCAIRATMHGGMLALTATDMQVLHGIFPAACRHRYGGLPARSPYSVETAIRLILGALGHIAARLDVTVSPVFAERHEHYYRVYARMLTRPDQDDNMGYLFYCKSCGGRGASPEKIPECGFCGAAQSNAGPLWTGALFDSVFLESMRKHAGGQAKEDCRDIIERCIGEAELPATYYSVDEIASRMRISPPSPGVLVGALREAGFGAAPTSFDFTGFRTDATAEDIEDIMKSYRP